MPPLPTSKRLSLSIETKLKILENVDKRHVPKSKIAKMFNIPKSTLFTIIKNRDAIMKANNSGVPPNRIRNREAKYPLLERTLLEWLNNMHSKNIPVDGKMLKVKAQTFAENLYVDETFKASDGWLQNFKLRNGLTFKKFCGESSSVNPAINCQWKDETLRKLLEKYNPDDIFNADETGLFYKLLPDRSLVFKAETCSGGKDAKQKITLLLAANMSGTEKLPLLIVGKSPEPRCFKGVKSLPVIYKTNRKARMTSEIFEEWLHNLDTKMAAEGRNILLIVDNCTAHLLEMENFKAVKVELLPLNVTSVLQPFDQGVIRDFKKHYRKKLINRILISLETGKPCDINVLSAIHTANAAWQTVSEITIQNCFSLARLVKKSCQGPFRLSDRPETDNEGQVLMQALAKRIPLPENITFDDYVAVDDNVECIEEFSEDDLIRDLLNFEENTISSSSDEELDKAHQPAATVNEATNAIKVLRNFFEREENSDRFFGMINTLENGIFESSRHCLKQKTIGIQERIA